MRVQIDTVQCRELLVQLTNGCAALEQAKKNARYVRLQLHTQTCDTQIDALNRTEQQLELLEAQLNRMVQRLSQLADKYEACEASVQSDIRQLPDANLFEQTLLQAPRPGHDPLLFFRGLNFYRSPRVPAFSHLALYELAWISPRRYFRLPSVPIRIHEFQSNRMKRSEYQFIINDPISIPPIGILALPGDAAPQPWLTNAVLHHLQTQTESSYAEEEHEHL